MDMMASDLLEVSDGATIETGRLPSRPNRRRSERVKLVIEISPDLHRRIIEICATRGVPVNQAVRNVLDHAFPR